MPIHDEVVLAYRVQVFLAHEAALLDAGSFDEWLALFARDALYWLPIAREQIDHEGQVSILCEDKALLQVRVARLLHPAAHAMQPRPSTVHMLGNVRLLQAQRDLAAPLVVSSSLLVTEHRDDEQRQLAAHVTHHLLRLEDSFEITLKRVDLVQCGGVLPVITIPL